MIREAPSVRNDVLSLEECGGDRSLDGKIDVLGNVSGCRRHPERVELGDHDAHDVAGAVEERATAVARLDRVPLN